MTMQSLWIIPATYLLFGVSAAVSQTPAPLPGTLAGQYFWQSGRKQRPIAVELSNISVEGEGVKGVVSKYSSPAGNCISEETPFNGTYKDGTLRIKSAPLKSQFADGKPCGGVVMELKLEGRHASGTIGSERTPIDLDAK